VNKLIVAFLLVAACSGPKAKPDSPIVKEGSAVSETCCCKSTPLTSDDGKPVFEPANRMDCSGKQGTCVDEVQCKKGDEPPTM
jgi:hypothetical protein